MKTSALSTILQTLISLALGIFLMLAPLSTFSIPDLLTISAIALIAIGSLGALDAVLYRIQNWGYNLLMSLLEIAVAVALCLTLDQNIALPIALVSGYALVRGLFSILVSARQLPDALDRLIWLAAGMVGVILAFVIFNSGNLDSGNTTFLKILGVYTIISALAELVYSLRAKAKPVALAKKTTKRSPKSRK